MKNKKTKEGAVHSALKKLYPNPVCALNYEKPHELLIAVRLSAQCTDKRVNLVTPALFGKYKSIDDFADADIKDVEELVHSCGLFKTKARDIVNTCKILREGYNYIIPDSIEELVKLPGTGRKTANLITGILYGKPAVVCDTHVIRISNRLGLISTTDPVKAEKALRALLPESESLDFCHRLVFFGREVCKARNPDCNNCVLKEHCIFCG